MSDDSFAARERELRKLAARCGKPDALTWLLPEKFRFWPPGRFVVRAGEDRAAIEALFREASAQGWAIALETVCYSASRAFATIELARDEQEIEGQFLRLGTVTLRVGENDFPVRVIHCAPCWWFWRNRTYARGGSSLKG